MARDNNGMVVDGRNIEGLIQQLSSNNMVARADFKPELFDKAIEQKGYRVLWQEAMFCSCLDPNTGQPDFNCPHCRGKSYVYSEPKMIRALVTSINSNVQQDRPGMNDMGTAYLTPSTKYNIGFRDRFTFVDFTTKFSEILTRGQYNEADRLTYPISEMISVRKLGTEFKNGIDFKIGTDGRSVQWTNQHLFPNDRYSVLYSTKPVYVAMGPIHDIRGTYTMAKAGGLEAFIQLPKQFQIKREDFLEDE